MSDILDLPATTDEKGVMRLPAIDAESDDFVALGQVGQVMESYLDQETWNMDVAKGLIRGVEQLPNVGGYALKLAGEGVKIAADSPSFAEINLPESSHALQAKANRERLTRYGSAVSEIGSNVTKFYTEAASKGMEAPNPAVMMGWRHPFRKTFSMAAESAPLMAAAWATGGAATALGASPTVAGLAAGSTMFPVTAGDMYDDAIKNGVKPEDAMKLAIATGAFQTATEGYVYTNWMKGGNIIWRIMRTAFQEGIIEEGSQQLFDNELRIIGWDDTTPIMNRFMDNVAESMAAGVLMGGVAGVFQPPTFEDIEKDLNDFVAQEGMKNKMTDEQIAASQKTASANLRKAMFPALTGESATNSLTVERILGAATLRLQQLGTKENGTDEVKDANGNVLTPSIPAQQLTEDELEEQQFLKNNLTNAEELAYRYGINLQAPPTPEAQPNAQPFQPTTQITTPSEIPTFKNTEAALAFGKTATPEQVKQLEELRQSTLDEAKQYNKENATDEELQKGYDLGVKAQLYREAIQSFGSQRDTVRAETATKIFDEHNDTINTVYSIASEARKKYGLDDDAKWMALTSRQQKIRSTKIEKLLLERLENSLHIQKLRQAGISVTLDKKTLRYSIEVSPENLDAYQQKKQPKPVELADVPVQGVQSGKEEGDEGITNDLDEVFGVVNKFIPMREDPFTFDKVVAWSVRNGRNIAGNFEKFIGPKLEISKRFTQWMGSYAWYLGPNGTIKVVSIQNLRTLYHETGHFLDDYFKKIPVWRSRATRDEMLAVSLQMRPLKPDQYKLHILSIDPTTGKKLKEQTAHGRYRRSRAELIADYISAYVINPEINRKYAPNFTKTFEETIGRTPEFQYIVNKLREFDALFKPYLDMVNELRKIPEINIMFTEWKETGNPLQLIYRKKVGDIVWNKFSSFIDGLNKNKYTKSFLERGAMNDIIFSVLRQRRKFISGQIERLKEEIVIPLSKLSAEEQTQVAEMLQDVNKRGDPNTVIGQLTEKAREELVLWGNEARVMGLLDDVTFFNNVGQYFPFFYKNHETVLNKLKKQVVVHSTKTIRANFDAFMKKKTDHELGIIAIKKQQGKGKKARAIADEIIANSSVDAIELIGRQYREEELGLIKTAAYPIYKRISQLIETVYTVRAFNALAELPMITEADATGGAVRMPKGKKYGELSGRYVPKALADEVMKWTQTFSDWDRLVNNATSIWKMFKVPYSPSAVFRNMVTNVVMSYIADVPIWDVRIAANGINSFTTKDAVYKALRDNGLYHNSYADNELQKLAFMLDKDTSGDMMKVVIEWAKEIAVAPAQLYGAIEDASKTIMARYAMDKGATPYQAVEFADKYLFDYGQVSEVTAKAKRKFFPFVTWSVKVLPRLVEMAIRKPEKIFMIASLILIFNGITRSMIGIDSDEEEKKKPEYLRNKLVLLMPERDSNGDLNWIDMTFFLPWGSWLPFEGEKLVLPQVFTMSHPFLTVYNASVLNNDPFYGQIAPDYLPEEEQFKLKAEYVTKNLGPNIVTISPFKIIAATKKDRYGRKGDVGQVLLGELTGIRVTRDVSAVRSTIVKSLKQKRSRAVTDINNKRKTKEIDQAEYRRRFKRIQEDFKKKVKSY